MIERNHIYLMDCMDGMAQMADKSVDLAIVDPPYGIGITNHQMWTGEFKTAKDWDTNIPDDLYFDELFRISKHQIVWGGNYFNIGATKCYLIWDKMNGTNDMADAEMAWTSFSSNIRIFRMHHFSRGYEKKIHPTQKPLKLYKWLLSNYAKEGDLILDTHMGSGSSYIACLDMGFDYIGFEIDEDYFAAIQERVYHFTRQGSLF